MKKYNQKIVDNNIGDCFRACMATLLQLPPEVLPNDFSPAWHRNWQNYLEQFGLSLSYSNRSDQPIWLWQPWIASVPSLNYKNTTHAILMHQSGVVLHDPSTKKKYKTGRRLNSNIVQSGQHLIVNDSTKLHLLEAYRKQLNPKGKSE